MHIFTHEIRRNIVFTLIWTVVITGVCAIILSFYPVIQSDMHTYLEVLDHFPPVIKASMGIFTELFTTPLGYYTFGFTMSILFAGLQALILGVSIVSKEVRDQTADFLMTKPVTRAHILSSKIVASLFLLSATCIVFSLCMYTMLRFLSSEIINLKVFLLLSVGLFFLQTIFYFIGLLVSVVSRKIRTVLPVAIGIGLFFYTLSAFAVTSDSDKLRYFTPYEYMKPQYILTNEGYELSYVLCGIMIVIVSIVISYIVYLKRDIHSV